MRAWKWLCLLGLLGGCTLPPLVIVGADGGAESAAEASADDTGSEAAADAMSEASAETGGEPAVEAGLDAAEVGVDATPEASAAPGNDNFMAAIDLPAASTSRAEVTVNGTLVGATPDRVPAMLTATVFQQRNVWYRFTLTAPTLVYLDTSGSFLDTGLFLLRPDGSPAMPSVAGASLSNQTAMANDDCGCAPILGRMPALQATDAATGGLLGAGVYYVSVSALTPGPFVLNIQRIPLAIAGTPLNLQPAPLNSVPLPTLPIIGTRVGMTGTTSAITDPAGGVAAGCGFTAPNPEQGFWFFSCGGWGLPYLSLCPAHGGTFPAGMMARSTPDDPVMYLYSGAVSPTAATACNDDQLVRGSPSGCTAPYDLAPTLSPNAIDRGLQVVVVDVRGTNTLPSMPFTLGYSIQ